MGLSYRKFLPSDQGMLFIFPESGSYGFWMKDMNFSLDMVWLDQDKKVVGIVTNATPESYPDVFMPPSLIKYVLELNAGVAGKMGMATGTMLGF